MLDRSHETGSLIFLVEGDVDTRALIERWLEGAGHEVESFEDAETRPRLDGGSSVGFLL